MAMGRETTGNKQARGEDAERAPNPRRSRVDDAQNYSRPSDSTRVVLAFHSHPAVVSHISTRLSKPILQPAPSLPYRVVLEGNPLYELGSRDAARASFKVRLAMNNLHSIH